MTRTGEHSDGSKRGADTTPPDTEYVATARANDTEASSDVGSRFDSSTSSRRRYLQTVGAVISLGALGGCGGTAAAPKEPADANASDASAWHGAWAGTATVNTYEITAPFGGDSVTSYSPLGTYHHDTVEGNFSPPLQSQLGAEANPLSFQIAGLTPNLADGDFFLNSAIVLRPTLENPQTGIARFWECVLSGGSLSGLLVDDPALRAIDGFNFVIETSPVGQYASPLPYSLMGHSRLVATASGNEIDIRIVPPPPGQRLQSTLMAYTADIQMRLTRQ